MSRLMWPVISLVALLASGVITASGASASSVLVLKEEGVPVPVGAELGVELESACKLTQRAHMSLNGAKSDKIAVEPAGTVECHGEFSSGELSGGITEVTLKVSSRAILTGAPLVRVYRREFEGPGLICTYEVKKFFGTFPDSGHPIIEGSMLGKVNRQKSFEESREHECGLNRKSGFRIAVTGHNGKPLETELVATRGAQS